MIRSVTWVKSEGTVQVALEGEQLEIPVIPGLLKHLTTTELRPLLHDPEVLRKYTLEALRLAPWQVLREFPRPWVRRCLPEAGLSPERRDAIEFLLKDRV